MADSRLHELSELGQSVWIDFLSRDLLRKGELARMMRDDAVVGVTSNPTIFQKAISEGEYYDEQLREVLAEEDDPKEVFLRLAVKDVQDACDLLRKVWDQGEGKDGYVSIEVDPNLAYDTDATIAEAQRLHDLVDRPNCFVKIPGTNPGLAAIEEMVARGRNINVTLIFSLARYDEVIEAYLSGLESHDGDLSRVASVASFFVSRVDTEVDRRLEAIGTPEALELRGKAAVAQAQLAYATFLEHFRGPRWDALVARGARVQRPLWASTSTKNPAYPDTHYVDPLIGPDTVNTMPEATLKAFDDHGTLARTVDADPDAARATFDAIRTVGVDLDDVSRVLEDQGVASFAKSFDELITTLSSKAEDLSGKTA